MEVETPSALGAPPRGGQAEPDVLLAARSALDSLSVCVEHIQALIDELRWLLEDGTLHAGAARPGTEPPAADVAAPARETSDPARLRVSYGGGPSLLAPEAVRPAADRELAAVGATRGVTVTRGVTATRAVTATREGAPPPATTAPAASAPPAASGPRVTARELIIVSELAHAGFSREQIAERLRAEWGEQAAAVLREALGDAP